MGDKITMITPETNVTPVGILPRIKRFTVVGMFEAGMYEYDSALSLINLKDAQKLFQMNAAVSGIRIKLDKRISRRRSLINWCGICRRGT